MAHRLAGHDELLQIVVRTPTFPRRQMVRILLIETTVHVFRIMDKTWNRKRLHGLRLFRRRPSAKTYQQRIFQLIQHIRFWYFRLQTAMYFVQFRIFSHCFVYITIPCQPQHRRRPRLPRLAGHHPTVTIACTVVFTTG